MRLSIITVIIFVVASTIGISKAYFAANYSVPPSKTWVVGTFVGTLPCADCEGVETELTLNKDEELAQEGTYILRETYVDKGGPYTTIGHWKALERTSKGTSSVVYQLSPSDPENSRYFLKVGEDQIKLLNSQQQEIQSNFNYVLTKR